MVGANDSGLKREVIPVLDQLERNLGRMVELVGQEDNTQCIAAIKRGYSPSLRYLKRHCRTSLGFSNEVFYGKDETTGKPLYRARLEYTETLTSKQKGDWMTKGLDKTAFENARWQAGYRRLTQEDGGHRIVW